MLSALIVIILAACQLATAGAESCKGDQFACANGSGCIDKKLKCDGFKHCTDGSDETFKSCFDNTCDENVFHRCNYGGCVANERKCDDEWDCWDKSDENKFLCANKTHINVLFDELLGSCSQNFAVNCDKHLGRRQKCLKWSEICDGRRDCSDGTDESIELCSYSLCPPNSFRCENGACIDSERFCNREIDCADGSDEIPDLCIKPIPRQDTDNKTIDAGAAPVHPHPPVQQETAWSFGCRLYPQEGMRVTDYFSEFSYRSDAEVPLNTVVTMTCDKGYESFDSKINKCLNYEWTNAFSCVRTCTQSVDVRNTHFMTQCSYNKDLTDCKQNTLMLGAELLVACATGFKAAGGVSQLGRHTCNETGLWFTEDANPKCEAICGIKSIHHPDITPWTVSIFQRNLTKKDSYEFKCSGTIISPYVVLTAESCVYDQENSEQNHIYFSVVEGDYSVSYNQFEDHGYNLHNISDIHIVSYKASQKLAIITLVKPFKFGAKIRPVCLEPTSTGDDVVVESNGEFGNYKKGQALTIFENDKYTLTHLVVNHQMSYNVKPFMKPIGDDITKSERIL